MRHLLLALLASACGVSDHDLGADAAVAASDATLDAPSRCPPGETCSAKTPHGLQFVGAQPVFSAWPNGSYTLVAPQIMKDGTDEIRLERVTDRDEPIDLALPYSAVSSDPTAISIEKTVGPVVTVRGHGGSAFLRIVDPATGELFDRTWLVSSPPNEGAVVGTAERVTQVNSLDQVSPSFVFATGTQTVGFSWVNDEMPRARLIDTSQGLALAGATQTAWDQLRIVTAAAGTYDVAQTVLGSTLSFPIIIVDHVENLAALFAKSGIACFAAYASGGFISGIPWTFTVGDQQVAADPDWGPNCVANPAGILVPFTVTATAGGVSQTITSDTEPPPARPTLPATSAGERAAHS